MKRKRAGRVAEPTPVQVYLARPERERLERLAERLDVSKSDVLRQGIEALEREVTDPARDPLLRIIGMAGNEGWKEGDPGYSVAREHDRFLAETEMAGWGRKPRRPRPRRGRGG
jgi:hypothetical protein